LVVKPETGPRNLLWPTATVHGVIALLLLLSVESVAQGCLPDSAAMAPKRSDSRLALPVSKSLNEAEAKRKPGLLARIERIFTARENLVYVALGGTLALQISQFDGRLSQALHDGHPPGLDVQIPAALGGGAGSVGTVAGTYFFGKVVGNERLAHTAAHMGEALAVSEGFTLALKFAVHRRRPDGSDYRSFPSGHTSGSFAIASVVDRVYGHGVGFPLYGVAAWIGFSRIRQQKHYPSDVIAGATLGVIVGRTLGAPCPERKKWGFHPTAAPRGPMLTLVKQL